MPLDKKNIHYASLICLLLGFTGILFSSHSSNYKFSESTYIISSLFLGLCLLICTSKQDDKSNYLKYFIVIALFSVAIIKVLGLHIKYGMYLGADSVAEFSVIRALYAQQFSLTGTNLTEFPLSYIYVYLTSSIVNIHPVFGPWNLIHLITNALTVVFLYFLIADVFNRNVAIISCIAYMYNPAVSIYSLSMTRENFGVLFLVMSVYIMQLQSRQNIQGRVILYAIFITSLIISHYTTAYFSLLTIALIFSIGYVQYLVTGKVQYRHFYILIFVIFLFAWVFNITYHHQGDFNVANDMISGVKDFFQPDAGATTGAMEVASHRETSKILNDFSLVQALFKVQAAFLALGSIFLIINIRKLSKSQLVFAILASMYTALIALSAFVPSIADAMSPTRMMRYGIIFACISVGYLFNLPNLILKYNNQIAYTFISVIVLSIVFIYPINQWIATEYMAFTPEPYPSQLRSEMYNIRSTHEISILERIDLMLPINSTLALEMPLSGARNFILQKSSIHSAQLNEEILFNETNIIPDNFIFLRKSLYEHKQYIVYPDKWMSATSFKSTINDSQWVKLDYRISHNNIVYDEGRYKLMNVR